jgi:hypothetical protein
MTAPAFIADPAGNADMAAQFQIFKKFLLLPGKTMDDHFFNLPPVLFQDSGKIGEGVPFMEEKGEAEFYGQTDLFFKTTALNLPGRKIPVIVQTTFSDSHHFPVSRKFPEDPPASVSPVFCPMGMDPCGGITLPRKSRRVFPGGPAVFFPGSGNNEGTYPPFLRGAEYKLPVPVKGRMHQVDTNIHKPHIEYSPPMIYDNIISYPP